MLTLTHVDSFYDAIIPKGFFLDLSAIGVRDKYTMFTHIHDVEIVSLDVFKWFWIPNILTPRFPNLGLNHYSHNTILPQ